MLSPILYVNQAYSIMIERERQRVIAHTIEPSENVKITTLMSNRSSTFNRYKKIFTGIQSMNTIN